MRTPTPFFIRLVDYIVGVLKDGIDFAVRALLEDEQAGSGVNQVIIGNIERRADQQVMAGSN